MAVSVAVSVRDLTVEFADRGLVALDGVSFEIEAGERVALLGPSGAGKSTLLRALLGAVPAAGEVRVGGHDPYGRSVRKVRRDTGFLRQGDDLILGVSARLNALMGTVAGWRLRGWGAVLTGRVPAGYADRLAELASRHGVGDCLAARASQLSGGQRQRIALIRALLPSPGLLLADEPTTGLDPVTAAAAVDALHDAGATVIAATHDLAVAATFPRIVALRAGRIVYDGPAIDEPTTARIYQQDGYQQDTVG
ncbi:ATP-binding cassette domain-containing protein [Actinophytocola sp.]|uniref:ATP-binding cassette domain-containing protein n=1 Tax=Actinophytocola sp. TaxID=1872138 RepID=UPI003D6BFFE2